MSKELDALITGANGFLGRYLKKEFSGNFFHTLGRSACTYNLNLAEEVPVFSYGYKTIVHAAGKAHLISNKKRNDKLFYEVNTKGTLNLLAGIERSKKNPESFIFISSVAVYGKDKGENINEDSPLIAKDFYGLSKTQAEHLVLDWCQKNNVICTILRLPLLVGQNPPGNLGAMIKGIKRGYYFNIGGGKAKKSMVLAEDVAKAIVRVSNIGGVYNLTDGYHPTFSEISNCMSSHLGKGKPLSIPLWLAAILAKFGDFLGDKAPINTTKLNKITSDLTFDDSKARETFGWSPRKVVDWYADKH